MDPMHSFVFVRHPFERLVSIYFEKIVRNPLGAWKSLSQEIIANYRITYKRKPLLQDSLPR